MSRAPGIRCRVRRTAAAAWLSLAALAGAAQAATPSMAMPQILEALRQGANPAPDTEALSRAAKGLQSAAELDLKQASKALNEALQLDTRNSYLHFFNGFIYHLQARQGDTSKTDLAIEGYQQATRLDPGNWIAHEFLGLAMVEQKQYAKAQGAFAEVLLQRPEDPVVLSRMLAVSYLAGDARTACSMADRLGALPQGREEGFLRSSVAVYAACGEFTKAEAARTAFEAGGVSPADAERVGRRISQWQQFHRAKEAAAATDGARMIKTQLAAAMTDNLAAAAAAPAPTPAAAAPAAAATTGSATGGRMVLVDVVMVRTEDSISTLKGVNLMSALQLQLGSGSAPAYSRNTTSSSEGSTSILTRALTVPALAYSLNLANANSNLNEVLARPTLAAVEGMRSEFFSGTSLNAAVVSGGSTTGGSSVSIEKRYGVKLSVLPQIMPDGMIKLAIDASRTFLKPPSANIGFTYKLEISEILANANVVLRMGDTLVLGGLSEKESTNNRDGVPVLQDVPLLQYLFSQQTRTDYQRSVLILITPRPAAYTWLSEESRAAAQAQDGDNPANSIEVLRARYGDWFKPYPNLASVFHHLNSADLYREFRTADVTLERWDRMSTTQERLKQALGFLYY